MANRFARNFAGTGYGSISDAAQTGLDLAGEFTLEAWIKPTGTASVGAIVSKWGNDGAFSWCFQLSYASQLLALLIDSNGTGAYTTKSQSSPVNLADGAWHHVAVTHSLLADEIRFFVDGAQAGATQAGALSVFNGGAAVMVGARENSTPYRWLGRLDDVRVWNAVRTPAEIAASYQTELTGAESGLVADWLLEDAEGDDFADLVGNNPLTVTATTLVVDPAYGTAPDPPTIAGQVADDPPGGIGLV